MLRRLGLTLALLSLVGCYAPPRGGGVTPYPPGPIDTLGIVFGNDYSRLCPQHFEYCRAGKHSICCPRGACCDDGNGPYCCDTRGYDDYRDRDYRDDAPTSAAPSGRGPCGDRATTCSRGGVTVCCAEDEGCCADERGLYCCASTRGGGY